MLHNELVKFFSLLMIFKFIINHLVILQDIIKPFAILRRQCLELMYNKYEAHRMNGVEQVHHIPEQVHHIPLYVHLKKSPIISLPVGRGHGIILTFFVRLSEIHNPTQRWSP